MKILAIETSCDETAIAVVECSGSKRKPEILVLSNLISSQVKLHAPFGGVVPNLAKREHQKSLVPLLLQSLNEAGLFKTEKPQPNLKAEKEIKIILEREVELLKQFKKSVIRLSVPNIDAIAVTYGPGLAPALWVGVNFAKALAFLWKKPLIPVNHMEGHVYSPLLKKSYEAKLHRIEFPALALLVSGGHTELVLVSNFGRYKIIGETRDDAAGEAFDKVARMLGFPYPGGPEISRLAEKGNEHAFSFPRPMIGSRDYDFSFSGLKTAVRYCIRDLEGKKIPKADLAASFEQAVVDVLVKKTIRAAKAIKVKTILLGGGVAANKKLRTYLREAAKKEIPEVGLLEPEISVTGDNALMIALAAYVAGKKKAPMSVEANANLRL